jgi:hypothetical protein
VLTSFLLPILQTAFMTATVTPSITALLIRTIMTVNMETETGIGTGTVAGEKETIVKGTPHTANGQTAATTTGNVTGIVNMAVIMRKDTRATTRNTLRT